MKRLLLIFGLLLGVIPCWSACTPSWTHAQARVSSATIVGSTVVVTLGSAPATGSVVVVEIAGWTGSSFSVSTVKDSNSNSYVVVAQGNAQAANAGISAMAYLLSAPANAAAAITVTYSTAPSVAQVWADNFSAPPGGCTVGVDTSTTGSGTTGTTINTPSITPAVSTEMFTCVAISQNGVSAVNAPWTGGTLNGSGSGYDLSVSSALALNMTQTSGAWQSSELALEQTGSGGACTPTLTLMGVGRCG